MTSGKAVIGVDESGKGDFFGPLVVASFLANDSEQEKLRELGVKDSKTLTDKKILQISDHLRTKYPFSIVVKMPLDYNREYALIKNLNIFLATCHAEAINNIALEHEADLAISDKFSKKNHLELELKKIGQPIQLKSFVKGESFLQVAAASIIARAEFVNIMVKLSSQAGMTLPKGAAPQVDKAGRELVAKHSVDALKNFAKLHFKNYHRVVNPVLFG